MCDQKDIGTRVETRAALLTWVTHWRGLIEVEAYTETYISVMIIAT